MTRNAITMLALLPALAAAAFAEVQVATVIGDGMVLQRGKPVPIWGVADPGETVTVTFADQTKTATTGEFGKWLVKLDQMTANATGRTLTAAGSSTVTIPNVVVGDVWLMIATPSGLGGRQRRYLGQKRSGGYSKLGRYYDNTPFVEADEADGLCDSIRAFGAPSGRGAWAARPQSSYGRGKWQILTFKHWGSFDGMSYYFARTCLRREGQDKKIPVGLLRCNPDDLQALTPPVGFDAVADTKALADETRTWDPASETGRQAYQAKLVEIRAWAKQTGRELNSDRRLTVTQPPRLPGPTPGTAAPTTTYNYSIHGLTPFGLRGILIKADYRNITDEQYTLKATGLIAGLRSVFADNALPVCWLQMRTPMYFERNAEPFAAAWRQLRARQTHLKTIPNVDVVGTYDFVIDPRDPRNWGVRMARWANALVADTTVHCGPIYKSHRIDGRNVIVEFDHVGAGLMVATRQQGEPAVKDAAGSLATFQLAGADKKWHAADAVVRGRTVVVSSPAVAKPLAVRYADMPEPRAANLYNLAGFPALPIRTPLE